jgi:hypothetical protein
MKNNGISTNKNIPYLIIVKGSNKITEIGIEDIAH